MSAVNDRHLTIKALEMALKRRCPEIGLLHHSDQGCTYASADYQVLLDARGIVCSMSRRGNCYDNAVMESFFSTVKSELADRFDTYGDAKMELFDYIEVFYNQRRRHSTLGQISPAAFERRANEEGVDPMENRQGRGFPQAPHPLSFSMRKEQTTKNDQRNETVHCIVELAQVTTSETASTVSRVLLNKLFNLHRAHPPRRHRRTSTPERRHSTIRQTAQTC